MRQDTHRATGLPELTEHDLYARDGKLLEYAENANVSAEWVRKRIREQRGVNRPLARALLGIPVLVDGNAWGVIVIDSSDPEGISAEAEKMYELFAPSLTTLLMKV